MVATIGSMGKMTLDKLAVAIAKDFAHFREELSNLKKEMNDRFDEVNRGIGDLERYTREGFADIRTNIENYRLETIDMRSRLERAERKIGD